MSLGEGLMVGAVVAVNAFGDVIDPESGRILAGARSPETNEPADTLAVMRDRAGGEAFGSGSNTVIGVVATSARLTKEEVNKVAQMAQDGVARTVRPAHTMYDGDTLFALATGRVDADVNLVGSYAAEVVAEAVVRAVRQAGGAGGLPAWNELGTGIE
jgi:L-aminopeptidase/D-esterase-like protein